MIVNERIVDYICSLEKSNSKICEEIEEYAIATHVPIIRKEMESFLRVMLTIKKPKRILEVGSGIGYSAVLMSEYISADSRIDTIENYKKRIPLVKENIKKAAKENVIKLYEGDATDILKELKGPYDFIFMDAAKAQYINFLPDILRLLSPNGVLISDNVLQEGSIIDSKFVIERRDRTIHKRMRDYLYELKHNEKLETTIVPIGDGITMSVKIGD